MRPRHRWHSHYCHRWGSPSVLRPPRHPPRGQHRPSACGWHRRRRRRHDTGPSCAMTLPCLWARCGSKTRSRTRPVRQHRSRLGQQHPHHRRRPPPHPLSTRSRRRSSSCSGGGLKSAHRRRARPPSYRFSRRRDRCRACASRSRSNSSQYRSSPWMVMNGNRGFCSCNRSCTATAIYRPRRPGSRRRRPMCGSYACRCSWPRRRHRRSGVQSPSCGRRCPVASTRRARRSRSRIRQRVRPCSPASLRHRTRLRPFRHR